MQEEKQRSGVLLYDSQLYDKWSDYEDPQFLAFFNFKAIDKMNKLQLRQVLYVAQEKDLLLSIDPDICKFCNSKAWPDEEHYEQRPRAVVKQIKARLLADYEAS